MVIKPKIRNNICMNAHPEGCALNVKKQIAYVKSKESLQYPKNALVIGCSNGYGLATRIAAAFGAGAGTIGVAFEKPSTETRPGSAGWYHMQAFDREAEKAGLISETINADAFSYETKHNVAKKIKQLFGSVDLVIYSLASGVRIHPDTGEKYRSALKPIGKTYRAKSVDPMENTINETVIEPANKQEVHDTVKVMGGEDWKLWIDVLNEAGVLSEGAMTLAYSYIGPAITYPVYREGTIGKAKEHLEQTAKELTSSLSTINGNAIVSVNKALVTRASAVIPVVPLYLSILFKVMKEKSIHEGCIEQMYRLIHKKIGTSGAPDIDKEGRIRLDDYEMRPDVQNEVQSMWDSINTGNLKELSDIEGYNRDFLQLHGFGFPEIDYDKDVTP